MRLIYFGDTICDFHSLKRLFCFADALYFLDLPAFEVASIRLPGRSSEFRRLEADARTVKVEAADPVLCGLLPAGLSQGWQADLASDPFKMTLAEGLEQSENFKARARRALGAFLANPTDVDKAIRAILLSDQARLVGEVASDGPRSQDPARMIHDPAAALYALMLDVSVHITSALVAAQALNAVLVTDDEWLLKLMSIRISGGKATLTLSSRDAVPLGQAILSDQMLRGLTLGELDDFRSSVSELYNSWLMPLRSGVANLVRMAEGGSGLSALQSSAATLHKQLAQNESKLLDKRNSYFQLGAIERGACPSLQFLHPALMAIPWGAETSRREGGRPGAVTCLLVAAS